MAFDCIVNVTSCKQKFCDSKLVGAFDHVVEVLRVLVFLAVIFAFKATVRQIRRNVEETRVTLPVFSSFLKIARGLLRLFSLLLLDGL